MFERIATLNYWFNISVYDKKILKIPYEKVDKIRNTFVLQSLWACKEKLKLDA